MKRIARKTKKVASRKTVPTETHTTDEVKRYIGVVREDFQHSVSAIAEQFLGLNKKLDDHGKKLDEHGRILNSHTEMIGRIMIDIEDIKVNMREKVGRDEFNKLETRLVSLESFVFSGRGKKTKTSKTSKN